MRLPTALIIAVLSAAICLYGQEQSTPATAAPVEAKGMPPRATPADYQAQAQAGTVIVAAEFAGHSVPTMQGPLSTEDFVVVETGFFGPPDARIKLSAGDFSLRINGKKTPLPSLPYGMVLSSLKDPEWSPPEAAKSKSKGGLSTGGNGDQSDSNAPPHRGQDPHRGTARDGTARSKSHAPGRRPGPFPGRTHLLPVPRRRQGIHSVELVYSGSAGKATLALQP